MGKLVLTGYFFVTGSKSFFALEPNIGRDFIKMKSNIFHCFSVLYHPPHCTPYPISGNYDLQTGKRHYF